MKDPILLCPHCLIAVETDRKCPRCGRTVDLGEWPSLRSREDISPCLSTGLDAPESEGGPYRLRSILSGKSVQGMLRTVLPFEFAYGKSCVCIGSSALSADVIVEGAAPLQAVLMLNRKTKKWWLLDCGSEFATTVNGERVRLHELQSGDRIGLVGISLAFRGDRLESGDITAQGLSLMVRNMTFKVLGRSTPILDRIFFTVRPGEFIGVLGGSGCGKSSLVQRIIGLSNEYTGEVLVNGHDRQEVETEFRAATAYLPQNVDQSLHESLTLEDEISCFRSLHLRPSPDDARENEDCLAALGLSGREQSRIGNLSGGEKRRVGIALALLRKPQLMLLDEPGAGLDPASEWTLMRHLKGIASQGRTVLCVTHLLEHADLFDKVLVLSCGRVVYFGPSEGVLPTFQVKNWSELYHLLSSGDVESHYELPAEDRTCSDLPEGPPPASFGQVIKGYWRRFKKEFLFRRSFWSSQPVVFWLWQPLGLVVGLRLACAYYFRMDNGGRPSAGPDFDMLGFCAALSVFWTGINNAARDLVRERVPGRCLERLNNVSYFGYLTSRFLWMLGMCLVEALSFTLLLCIAGAIPVPLICSDYVNRLAISPLWFIPLAASSIAGGLWGMAVSSISKKEIGAVSIVPNLAILALLFSNAIVRFEGTNESNVYVGLARTLAVKFMPCHWPAQVIEHIQMSEALLPDLWHLLAQLGAYLAASLVLVWHFQRTREKEWNGR